jgi:hypothetical protein
MAQEKPLDLPVVQAWLAAWNESDLLFRCRHSTPSVVDRGYTLHCRRHIGVGPGAAQPSVSTPEVRAPRRPMSKLADYRAERIERRCRSDCRSWP